MRRPLRREESRHVTAAVRGRLRAVGAEGALRVLGGGWAPSSLQPVREASVTRRCENCAGISPLSALGALPWDPLPSSGCQGLGQALLSDPPGSAPLFSPQGPRGRSGHCSESTAGVSEARSKSCCGDLRLSANLR